MPKITIYTTPTCGFCHMAKEYLKSRKIDFVAKDVTTDKQAYDELISKSGQLGVPVLDIDGGIVVGFNRPVIDALIREKKIA